MKNFWLERANPFRVGRRVRYKGLDVNLKDKLGHIVRLLGEWIDVQFEFTGISAHTKVISVEKDSLEVA